MIFEKKQSSGKLRRALLRWLTLGLLFASTHALAQTGGTVTYVYTDPQGTPLAETDASGNITATFDYTPYGTYAPNGTSTPGPNPNGPGYTGHVNDPETNLVYMQARYYDPATGHFLSGDPIAWKAGNTISFNRYAYADNNPIENVDPNGQQTIPIDEELRTSDPKLIDEVQSARADFAVSLMCGCDSTAYDSSGSGAVQSVVTPFEFGLAGGVARGSTALAKVGSAIASAAYEESVLDGANYAQRSYSMTFSSGGKFAGQTVDGVAAQLQSGSLSPNDVPIQYIVKDGHTLILNTRSAQALEKAGIPRAQWKAVNMTNDRAAQARLAQQLRRNNLTSEGTPTLHALGD